MRRVIPIHLILAIVAVLCYCYAVAGWATVKAVGLNAFPGYPDWSYTYFSTYERNFWMSGMLFGLVVAGVPLLLLARVVSGAGRRIAVAPVAAVAIPALALLLGHALVSNTVHGEGERVSQRSSLLVMRTFASYAGLSAYRER